MNTCTRISPKSPGVGVDWHELHKSMALGSHMELNHVEGVPSTIIFEGMNIIL